MSTATLSSLIGVLILGQVAGFALVARYRYRGKYRALQTEGFGDGPAAPAHRIPADPKQAEQAWSVACILDAWTLLERIRVGKG